jgi:hypothetical protein
LVQKAIVVDVFRSATPFSAFLWVAMINEETEAEGSEKETIISRHNRLSLIRDKESRSYTGR